MPIQGDVMDIARRIKSIDRGYYVVYNRTRGRFEVHHPNNKPNSIAVVIPYEQLDIRAYEYVLRTRKERMSNILQEIESHNHKLEMDKDNRILDEAGYKARHLVNYILGGGNNLPSYNEI